MIYVAFGSILLLVGIVLWAAGETLIEAHRFRHKARAELDSASLEVSQAEGARADPSDPVVVFIPPRRTLR